MHRNINVTLFRKVKCYRKCHVTFRGKFSRFNECVGRFIMILLPFSSSASLGGEKKMKKSGPVVALVHCPQSSSFAFFLSVPGHGYNDRRMEGDAELVADTQAFGTVFTI